MNILISGGSGFVGSALCRALMDAGHQPLVISRSPEHAVKRLPQGVQLGKKAAEFADQAPEAIVNLAGEPIAEGRWTAPRKKALLDSRINITRELVDFCANLPRPPRVMVSASAVGYYGDQGNRDVTEQTSPHDEFAHQLCKRWEAEAQRAEQYGVRVALLRIGLVLDAGGGMLSKTAPMFKLGLGGRLGDGQQYMPWIHRQDLIGMILFLLDRDDLSGAFNGSAPNPVTNSEFTRELGRALNRPVVLPAPALALKLVFGEMSRLLLTGAKMLPQRMEQAGYEFKFRQLDQALAAIYRH